MSQASVGRSAGGASDCRYVTSFQTASEEQQAAVRRHAVRPAVIDGLKDRPIRASEAPAPVGEARTHPAGRTAPMTAVAIHRAEDRLSLRRGRAVAPIRVLERHPRRCGTAGKHVLAVSDRRRRRRGRPARGEERERREQGSHRPNSHTMPP